MRINRRWAVAVLAGALLGSAVPSFASAQEFHPDRPVRIVVPYPPGGVIDIVGRELAKDLSAYWKESVIVDNRPGAAGLIGSGYVAHSPGDGLVFLVADDGVLVASPLIHKPSFNPQKDLVPIGTTALFPYLILGGPHSPSLSQLLATAKAKPNTVDYATNGVGGPHDIIWARWQEQLGLKMNEIPYNGTTPAMQDLAAGRVPIMITTPISAVGLIQSGKVTPLAAAAKARFPLFPNVPTATELGFPLIADNWIGFMAPGSMPEALRAKVGADLSIIVNSAAFKNAMIEQQNLPLSENEQQTQVRIDKERQELQGLVKRMNIQAH